ncbi:response regulator [Paenibacillus athensensis]|uniref:AraC family transcriptional regulator n=1 Tax=Paenibacillus athensensis TaxID=1967502 RepID=A0A4Y8Q817_9BACL|nr:response regulator [Paenibacillus athensensis]MCD1257302.1 response regulator [Paenibacillus athensensis]
MIRLLIVDDEPIERMALQKMIEDGATGIEVVGHAANGREAIAAADRLQPDLITMDIKMPGINGLEAIEKIKETNDTIKFIVVTAFDTFEFARQAIKLGVSDYMLKPSRTAVVLETIGKVAADIRLARTELEQRRLDRERLQKMVPIVEADIVSQLLFDYVPSIHLDEMIELLGLPSASGGFVMNVLLSTPADREVSPEELDLLYARLTKPIYESTLRCWIGKLSGKQLPLIVFNDSERAYRNHAVGLARKLVQTLRRLGGNEPFIGIGGFCPDVRELRKSYHEALFASADTTAAARFCLYEDLAQQGSETAGSLTAEMEKNVLEEVRRGHWAAAGEQIGQMIDVYEGAGLSAGMAQQRIFEVLIIVSRMLQDMGIDVPKPYYKEQAGAYLQLKAETRLLVGQLMETTETLTGGMETDLLQRMKLYIKEHAHEDLSLERVAATVGRNPFYISKLFKEHFGTNYIDFLTECRMEMAKHLMQETDKSLKEITFEIGYNDPNYFSRVFKKAVGHSPTDYRKMLLRPVKAKTGSGRSELL